MSAQWIVATVGCIECGDSGSDLLSIVAVTETEEQAVALAAEWGVILDHVQNWKDGQAYLDAGRALFVLPVAASANP